MLPCSLEQQTPTPPPPPPPPFSRALDVDLNVHATPPRGPTRRPLLSNRVISRGLVGPARAAPATPPLLPPPPLLTPPPTPP